MFQTLWDILKVLFFIILEYCHRCKKGIRYILTGKHEFERICEHNNYDIFEQTHEIEQWLSRTNCRPVKQYMRQNFENKDGKIEAAINYILHYCDGYQAKAKLHSKSFPRMKITNLEDCDLLLGSKLKEMTKDLTNIIIKSKHSRLTTKHKECLSDILYRILSYKLTLKIAERLASTKYNSDKQEHLDRLINFWNNLIKVDLKQMHGDPGGPVIPPNLAKQIRHRDEIVSNRWSHIGFQGEDPGTDFRGMGILGLIQLEYMSRKPKCLARNLLKQSLNEDHSYPFAIVGINVTYNLLQLYREGIMKHFYYDTGDILLRNKHRVLSIIRTFNEIYVELFLRFDCFWHKSKPKNIFEFKDLMEKFTIIVRTDLQNRNFSIKFIY